MSDSTEVSAGASAMPAAPVSVNPAQLLMIAVQKGADIESLEKLLKLQERWEAGEARKAYAQAIAAFKAECPEIAKDAVVDYTTTKAGRTYYRHASLAGICRTVDPLLAKHGLGYRWNTDQANGCVTVSCEVFHSAGHFESVPLSSTPDASGGKNSIQAIGSAVSYLKRYTLEAALGLASGEDDDGRAAGGDEAQGERQAQEEPQDPPLSPPELQQVQGCINHQQIQQLDKLLRQASWPRANFCQAANIKTINHLQANRYEPAVARINQQINRGDNHQ